MPDAEADDADAEQAEAVLLLGGDQVSIAVEPHSAIAPRTEDTRDDSSPGVVGPALGFRDYVWVGGRAKPAQLVALYFPPVNELDPGVRSQLR